MFKKSLFLCLIVVFALNVNVSWSGNDDDNYIIGLRYPKSYDIKTYHRWPEVRSVEYKVLLPYPSKDVIEFYDNKLKNIGWVPFAQPHYLKYGRKWDYFVDGTIKDHPIVHQIAAELVNKDRTRMVSLGIRYQSIYLSNLAQLYTGNPIPNNNIQKVFLMVMPFSILPPPTDPAPKVM